MFKKKNKENNDEKIAEKPAGVGIAEEPKEQIEVGADDLKELVEKNIKWSQVIYNQNKQIKRRLTMIAVLAWLKTLLIVVPIILGLIYLPPLFKEVWGQYGELLFGGADGGGGENLNNILNQFGQNYTELYKIKQN